MKKWLGIILSLAFVLVLAACGTAKEDETQTETNAGTNNTAEETPKVEETEKTTLVVGASNVPHGEILEEAKPLLAEKGIDLQIELFSDYVLPNKALESKDLDANYFQHIPFLELNIAENGYDFVNAGGIHIEPIAIYSKEYKSLDELPDGAHIIFSSSIPDHGRILSLLEKEGLIKLADGVDKVAATIDDVVENSKNLKFDTEYAPELLPQIFNNNEGDAVIINSNFAIDAGLNPVEDSIAIEGSESPYVNVIAVRSEDQNNEAIKTLIEVLHSEAIQNFILEKYEGAIVPVSE